MLDSVPADIRMDFLNHSPELRSPRAQYLQSFVPKALQWYSSVLLCMLFDEKLYNLDTPRFIAVRHTFSGGSVHIQQRLTSQCFF